MNLDAKWFAAAIMVLMETALPQGIRKNYTEMTASEQSDYLAAVNALYSSYAPADIVQELAAWYSSEYNAINYNPGDDNDDNQFLAWHRMALWEMEKALQAQNARLTIPYWDWLNDDSPSSNLFTSFLPTGYLAGGWSVNRSVGSSGSLPETGTTAYSCALNSTSWWYYGAQLCFDAAGSYYGFNPGMEKLVHDNVRLWVGGDMNTSSAPLDPVYYVHAAMMDKIWQAWEDHPSKSSSHTVDPLSRYDGYTYGPYIYPLPETNPNNIVDGRTSHGTFYTNGGVATLTGGYAVTNDYLYPEYFNYQYSIVADDFEVPSGTYAIIHSNSQISLREGFVAHGSLVLKVGEYDAPLAKKGIQDAAKAVKLVELELFGVIRHADRLTVSFHSTQNSPVAVDAFSPDGKRLGSASSRSRGSIGHEATIDVPISAGYRGILYLRVRSGDRVLKKMVSAI